MSLQETAASAPDQRRHLALILTILGVFDLAMGGVIAVFGPSVIDDPGLDTSIQIIGAVFAAAGAALLWLGISRKKALGTKVETEGAVRRTA